MKTNIRTFFTTSRSILLRMRNFSGGKKSCRENKKKHISYSITFPPENLPVYEIMWKNVVELDKPENTPYGACALQAG